MSPISRQQARMIDQVAINRYGVPGAVLMENAARGCAEILAARRPRRVILCCGKGNNGGDGLAMARHLDLLGVATQTLLFSSPDEIRGDAALQLNIVRQADLPLEIVPAEVSDAALDQLLQNADWIVDALLGTGVQGKPRAPLDQVIRAINRSGAQRMSIDLPSGLDSDTGTPADPTIAASVTVTMVAPKLGFSADSAKPYLGEVLTTGIGAPQKAIETALKEAAADT